jgi:OPA family sugar phosphate sensor protein UhpC-like MFS transporter
MASLYSYFRISKPSADKVPPEKVDAEYKRLRQRTFWGATVAYSLYYVCRMTLGVVKQPLIDDGVLGAGALGLIGSAMLFVYAFGKFFNGFIADYCNVRRFMAVGLAVSVGVNLLMGALGLLHGIVGLGSTLVMVLFFILWGINGWAQSMGSPPGVISLSRWWPLSRRGTVYSIFSSTPYLGKAITMITTGLIVGAAGWQWGFIAASAAGALGLVIILVFVSDTPESKGLPSIQQISGEPIREADTKPTRELQKMVVRHPGIWVIALSSAFIYITQYAISGWGVLFLQKSKDFSLEGATQVIGISEVAGIAGTVMAGWLSDTVFRGSRVKPVIISGILALAGLGAFLFTGGGYVLNIVYVGVFSLFIGVVYCVVAGLMALDFVPRKATGAALGIVGISSYVAAGVQDIVSGLLIQGNSSSAAPGAPDSYNFIPVAIFWTAACLLSFILPVMGWNRLKK